MTDELFDKVFLLVLGGPSVASTPERQRWWSLRLLDHQRLALSRLRPEGRLFVVCNDRTLGEAAMLPEDVGAHACWCTEYTRFDVDGSVVHCRQSNEHWAYPWPAQKRPTTQRVRLYGEAWLRMLRGAGAIPSRLWKHRRLPKNVCVFNAVPQSERAIPLTQRAVLHALRDAGFTGIRGERCP